MYELATCNVVGPIMHELKNKRHVLKAKKNCQENILDAQRLKTVHGR